MKNNFIIYHVGARDNYLLAEILSQKKKPFLLITDYWFKKQSLINFFFNKTTRRQNQFINENKIKSYNLLQVLFVEIYLRFLKNNFKIWNFLGSFFQKFVLKKIVLNQNDKFVFFGFTGGNFKVLDKFKNIGNVVLIHNQFDPGLVYYEIENTAIDKHKKIFLSNIQKEWSLADLLIVNSEYSKKCLIEKDVPSNKIKIVPLAYNKPISVFEKTNNSKLKIAFIGNINKIKGFKIFLEVAKQLSNNFEFIAIGNNYFNEEFTIKAKEYINFLGFLNKKELENYYKKIDILIFPTLCDGFGMVQLEAMANGIPVIASEFCAKIVNENENGFITNNVDEIISKLELLNANRDLLSKLAKNAINTAKEYNNENYLKYLNNALKELNIEI